MQIQSVLLVYAPNTPITLLDEVNQLIDTANLPLSVHYQPIAIKLTQKSRQQLSLDYGQPLFVIDAKQTLTLVTDGISVAADWRSLQRRVVRAGRKSELILQAAKINANSQVLDATAGFGHDSLILASTGAKVTMLERNPLMVVVLLHEQQTLAAHNHWRQLMDRLTIRHCDAIAFMQDSAQSSNDQSSYDQCYDKQCYDVVYLDPMFPQHSYTDAKTGKGAKVGKYMQALQQLSCPPTIAEEERLLNLALSRLMKDGRVISKRPIAAPPLGNRPPDIEWKNNVVRFDGYFGKDNVGED